MHLRRVRYLYSPRRLQSCKSLFRHPWRSLIGLAFLTRKAVRLTLHSGQTLDFSRRGQDHLFWDWFLAQAENRLEFTAQGEILLNYRSWNLLLRPGTTDFYIFREIFLNDEYGLGSLPGKLGTVVDLGGNVGLFSCAVLPRAKRVISVEPVQANYRQARRNFLLNGGNPADLLRYAVTGRSGEETTIYLSSRNTGMSPLFSSWVTIDGVQCQEKAPTLSLADLFTRTDCGEIDLLKCDVEGAEFDIFRNTPVWVLRQIRRLVMEVHLRGEQTHAAMTGLVNHLQCAGLEITCEKRGARRGSEIWFLRGVR